MSTIPVFAGLGSDELFSASPQALLDARSAIGQLLLSSCHQIFLDEISLAEKELPLGIDGTDFQEPHNIIQPCERYHQHPVVQHATLCVVQLLRYQSTSNAQPLVATSGFCAGLLTAVAVATSQGAIQYLARAEESFRAAVLLGISSERLRGRLRLLQPVAPWSLIVGHIAKEEISNLIAAYNSTHHLRTPIYISSINSKTCVTISSEGDALREFVETTLPPTSKIKATNIFTLYHERSILTEYREKLAQEFESRQIPFSSRKDLLVPLISTVDGSLILAQNNESQWDLLQDVLDMILTETTNWLATQETIVLLGCEARQHIDCAVTVCNYGPGYGALNGPKDVLPDIQVQDCSIDPRSDESKDTDIAIVGVGIDLPGSHDTETLWQNLLNGLNTCSEIPSERFHVEDYYNRHGYKPLNEMRSLGTKYGNFLEDLFSFDNQLFGISPREASSIDPQQRLMLQTVYRALESAGYVPDATPTFSRETFGCFVGNATLDYADNLRDNIDVYYSPGTLRAFLSGRISYAFKWSGPSITLDTACSSSLVALHQAARALLVGDCRAAVAGGVNVITSPDMYLGLDKGHFLSATGQCKAFDQSADGYCRSEGCAVFVLKKLSDAIKENDRVLGVIKGIEVNQSGQASSITHPHASTQEKLFRRLLDQAKLRPHDVTVAEAHGTGTQAGDPKELKSIRQVFCEGRNMNNPLHITSIKSNIGHCEAASGSASLAKLLLMLKHKVVPPQQLLETLNPAIDDLGVDGALISTQVREWAQPSGGRKRTALLNNFGAAGSNAALLLQEYHMSTTRQTNRQHQLTYVFGCSARTVELLEQMREEILTHITVQRENLAIEDVCYTSTARRGLHRYRLSVTASSTEQLLRNLATAETTEVPKDPRKIVFLFSGQGSQYLGMGKALLDDSPRIKEIVHRCHQLLLGWGFPGCLEIMRPDETYPPDPHAPETLEAFQSAVFVLEVAIARLLIDFGVRPALVAGHSLGEYAALVTAGVLDLESGLWLVAQRAHLFTSHCQLWKTSMLAVNMSSAQVRKDILSKTRFEAITIACDNSLTSCVVGGATNDLHELKEYLVRELGIRCAMLDVPLAYHTSAVDPIKNSLKDKASRIQLRPPSIPIASDVTGRVVQPSETVFTPEYFAQHCRQMVAFDQCITDILKHDADFETARWIEIGPQPTMLPVIATRLPADTAKTSPVLKKGQQPSQTLGELFAELYLDDRGAVNWRAMFEDLICKPSVIDLPLAPMSRHKYYVPFPRETSYEQQNAIEAKPKGTNFSVLQHQVEPNGQALAVFETPMANLASLISGHIVCGHALCPASVYFEMALAAVMQLEEHSSQTRTCKVSDVVFPRPLIFSEGSLVTIRIIINEGSTGDGDLTFEISTLEGNNINPKPKVHCYGKIKLSKKTKNLVSIDRSMARRKTEFQNGEHQTFSANTMYNKIFNRVVEYSPNYRAVRKLYLDDDAEEIFAVCQLPLTNEEARYAGQPILLDTMLHVAGFAANLNAENASVCICHQVHSTTIFRPDIGSIRSFDVHCSNYTNSGDPHTIFADAHAVDRDGIIAVIKGMEFRRTKISKIQAAFELASRARLETNTAQQYPEITLSRVESNSSQYAESASSGELSVGLEPPSPAISILSETTGINVKDLTSETDFDAIGVDSMMIFELEKKLEKAMDQRPSVLELSTVRTVGQYERLTNAMPSRSGTPALGVDSPHRTPKRASSYAKQNLQPRTRSVQMEPSWPFVRNQSAFEGHLDEPDVSQEMIELLRRRLGLDEQPERVQNPPPASTSAPLYLIHPGAGMCHEYRRIGSLRRAVYAIHDPCIFADLKDDWTSIEEMAEHYLYVIRRDLSSCATHGIILGGYSFGGVVAFEVARLLLERGQCKVQGVILIDAPPPLDHEPLSRETIEAAMAAKHLSHSRPRSKESAEFEAAVGALAVRNNLRRAALLGKYRPRRSGAMPRVILLRSSEGFQIDSQLPENRWLHDRGDTMISLGAWEELTASSVEAIDIPGDQCPLDGFQEEEEVVRDRAAKSKERAAPSKDFVKSSILLLENSKVPFVKNSSNPPKTRCCISMLSNPRADEHEASPNVYLHMAVATLLQSSLIVKACIVWFLYLLTVAIYRLYFHPLRRIPGPKIAALTWWYEVYYDVILPGQYNFKIQQLHKKYGPILRVNPDEVHIADKDFLGEVYGARKRNRLYEASLDTNSSVAGTTDYEVHRKRRHAMTGFFSPKAVQQLEPLLLRKRDILQDMIDQNISSARDGGHGLINLSDLYFGYCWDLIQEYAFALGSNVLSDSAESNRLRNNSTNLLRQVNFTRHFGWVNQLASLLPASVGRRMTPPGVTDLQQLAVRVRGNVEDVLRDSQTTREDIESETQHRSIFYTLRDDPALPASEKSPLRLQREGWFLVVAGSDTPARNLATTHFHLLDNPEYMDRLREELRPLGPRPSLQDLENLPFLDACILEGNRLSFGLSRRNWRTAPEDVVVYQGYSIPPCTPFGTSTLAVHADESIFPEPFAYRPDRWLGNGKDLRKYLMSYGAKGPRSCLGIHLAQAEQRLAIAAIARYDMSLFETSVRDVEYRHDFQMAHGDLNSQGVRARVKGVIDYL